MLRTTNPSTHKCPLNPDKGYIRHTAVQRDTFDGPRRRSQKQDLEERHSE